MHETVVDDSTKLFMRRMEQIHDELEAVRHELGRPDLLNLAARTRELLRRTKGLLDGNVNILFGHHPRAGEELYKHIEWAEGHLNKALAEECDFDAIKKRVYMATTLADYVIAVVDKAVQEMVGK